MALTDFGGREVAAVGTNVGRYRGHSVTVMATTIVAGIDVGAGPKGRDIWD